MEKCTKHCIIPAFDEVIERFIGNSINILDWNCGQSIATSLLLDYIKEKQPDINVSNIILVENNKGC